jgi:type VI secretion system protein ImpH
MAPAIGRSRAALSETLLREAHRFEFFQAVRLLELSAFQAARAKEGPRRKPVGGDHPPLEEAVRFRVLPSHSFPSGEVVEIRAPRGGETPEKTGPPPPEMVTAFLGLTGPQGALPQHYTTLLIERVRLKDFALRDFLDVFHHRILSLFHRAWEKYRYPIALERAICEGAADQEDLFTRCLYCLLGLGTGALRGRRQIDDEAFLYYGGFFAHFPRNAHSLERILADYFQLPVEIVQFCGQWLHLNEEDQSAFPSPRLPLGLNLHLGRGVVVGERVWDVEGKFRVRLGPLGYAEFCRFLPSGDGLRSLSQMIRAYAGPQFDFDVQLALHAAEAPWCRLGGKDPTPSRLGWNTWIRCRPFAQDTVSDAIFPQEGLPWTISV